MLKTPISLICGFLFLGCSGTPSVQVEVPQPEPAVDLTELVTDTEFAFADTMAARDFEAFASFLADEAVFFSGPRPLRGKQAVLDAWKLYFVGEDAPFSWEPEQVVVLQTGDLALSTGSVYDPDGQAVGTFNSIWRCDEHGQWRIVFDKGGPAPAGASETP